MKNHVIVPLLLIAVMYTACAVNSNSLDTSFFHPKDKQMLVFTSVCVMFYYAIVSVNCAISSLTDELVKIFKK